MKYTVSDVKQPVHIHTCRNCKQSFTGKICNHCGEKVFNEKHLTAGHFFHQVIDFFWHWENKVLKTIKLNTFKPGFITKENLSGVTVPYAKPVQLYLVMSVVFFLGVSKIGVTDYIPSLFDFGYYSVSDYKIFKWARPADEAINYGMLNLIDSKQKEIVRHIEESSFYQDKDSAGGIWLKPEGMKDSMYINKQQLPVYINSTAGKIFSSKFNSSIATYGKTLIFFILPLIGAVFFLFFFRKLKYYGAALVFAVHFMVYNMLAYLVMSAVYYVPLLQFGSDAGKYLFEPFNLVFYNKYTSPVFTFVMGPQFEFDHLVFWMPWFFIAFKRLFNTVWWKNLLISWFCSRVFFYLIFGVLKKLLIAFTVWSMH